MGALGTPAKVATAVKVWVPLPKGALGVTLQRPAASTVALPTSTPLALSTTVLPGTPVPLTVGVVSLVLCPFCSRPVRSAWLSLTPVMLGTVGASPRSSNTRSGPGPPTLPASSTGAARMMCAPSASGASGVKLHARVCASTVAVPSSTPLS